MRISYGVPSALVVAGLVLLGGCTPSSKTTIAMPDNQSPKTGDVTSQDSKSTAPGASGTTSTGAEATKNPDPATNPTPGGTTTTTPPPPAPTVTGVTADGPVTLQFALDKGATYVYKTEMNQSYAGASAPKVAKGNVMTTETTVKVLDVTGGKTKLELHSGKINMNSDTDNAEAKKMVEKAVKDAEGVVATMLMDATGKSSDMKYSQGNKMSARLAGFDFDTGFFGISYPGKSTKPGQTWNHTLDFKQAMEGMMPMGGGQWANSLLTTTFSLKSIDPTAGTASLTMSISGNPTMSMKMPDLGEKAGQTKANMPKEIKMSFKISGSGTATVELKTGLPREIVFSNSTEIESQMTGKMTQNQKVTVRRTK